MDQLNHRRATAQLQILNPDGTPAAHRPVEVRQVSHKFLFGCGAFDALGLVLAGDDERRAFSSDFRKFSMVFDELNTEKLPITAGDALLVYLEVHAFQEIKKLTTDELRASLSSIWADIRLSAQGDPISVATEPEAEKEKSLLSRILGSPRLNVAFIYDFDPEKSAWAAAHWEGQKYLEEKLGQNVKISSFLCVDGNADETMEKAVEQGANVIFATSPMLMDECRRLAAKHKNIAIFNCALSMPYAGVRSYYCRIYEGNGTGRPHRLCGQLSHHGRDRQHQRLCPGRADDQPPGEDHPEMELPARQSHPGAEGSRRVRHLQPGRGQRQPFLLGPGHLHGHA